MGGCYVSEGEGERVRFKGVADGVERRDWANERGKEVMRRYAPYGTEL